MLVAENISVSIGAKPILQHVSLKARPGEMLAIVGPNGSGKTTLLKAITGDQSYTGNLALDGVDMRDISGPKLATRRAVLPQNSRLAFPFTVLEVVRLGLISGLDAADDTLPSKALTKVGLNGFEPRFYHELSGGEQQRCQLARILVQAWLPVRDGKATWLILDEPVSALDIGHQLDVMRIARGFANAGGGVIAVMHDLNLTSMYSDRIMLLSNGRVLANGTPSDVLQDEILSKAYGCDIRVNIAPEASTSVPYVLPQSVG